MSLGHAPPAHKSAWRPFVVLDMLEDTLATGGFPDEAPEELESMSFRALLRFFEKCMRDSSPKKRRFGANPQALTNVPRRPSSGGGSGSVAKAPASCAPRKSEANAASASNGWSELNLTHN